MPEFNSSQFRQAAFRGFGDQAMRHHRATPAPQQPDTPASASVPSERPSWSQPELPTPSQAPASAGPARLTSAAQARADIKTARAQALTARVATAQARAEAAQHRLTAAQARTAAAQARATSAQHGAQNTQRSAYTGVRAGPVHGPQTRMNWLRSQPPTNNTPPAPTPGPTPQPRAVRINTTAYRNAGPSRPAPTPAPARTSPAPQPPPPPATPPPAPTARPAGPPTSLSRALPVAGLAVGLGARAVEGWHKLATDPKNSGKPLHKTKQGWMRS